VSTFSIADKAERNSGIVSKKLKTKRKEPQLCPCKAEEKCFKHNLKKLPEYTCPAYAGAFFLNSISSQEHRGEAEQEMRGLGFEF